jgi:AcrR family transcriptional regulator
VTQPPAPPRRPGRSHRSGRRGGDSGTREAILAAARTRFGDLGYDGATIRGIAADAGVDAALVHHFFGTKERLFVAAMRLPLVPGEIVAGALAPGAREPGRSLGEHLLRTVLGAWDVAEMRATFLGLLRSAVSSEQAADMLREFATEAILGRIAGAAGAGAGSAGTGAGPGQAGASPGQAGTGPGQAAGDGPRVAGEGDGPGAAPGPGGAAGTRMPSPEAQFRAALVASQVLGLALTRYVLELEPLVRAGTDDLAAAIGPTLERYLSGDIR